MLKKMHGECAGRWLALANGKLVGCLLLFFCVGLSSGCGAAQTVAQHTDSRPTPAISPFRATIQTFDASFTLLLAITPNHSGVNFFTLRVVDRAGKPVNNVKVTLYTTMQDMPMGTDSVVLRADGPGQFSATSNVLSMSGHWAIGITVQTADQVLHKAGVSFVLPA